MRAMRVAVTPSMAMPVAIFVTGAVTALTVSSHARFGFDHREAEVSVDTIAGLTAMLAAFLFFSRIRHTRLLRDAVLCGGLLVLALGNIAFSVAPTLVGSADDVPSLARVDAALVGAVAFTIGSWLPRQRTDARLVALVPAFAIVAIGLAWAGGALTSGLHNDAVASVDTFSLAGGSGSSLLQGIAAALFLAAALGLTRGATAEGDSLLGWFAVAAVFAAASRFDFALSTSASSPWVVVGNVFRLAFYATLGVGAALEIQRYFVNASKVAILDERRRVARDLHDGMAQELAFIGSQARWLASDTDPLSRAGLIASAAQRALDESRRAIAALTRPLDEPLDVAVSQAAEDVAHRLDVTLEFHNDEDLSTNERAREALVRIVREAVSNAGRHAGASRIKVELRRHDGVLLCVEDDGVGFDPDEVGRRPGHLGLVSMRERAEAEGGRFAIRSIKGHGTTVEVWVP